MKTTLTKLYKNDVVCMFFLLLGIVYSMYYFDMAIDPVAAAGMGQTNTSIFYITLSWMGRLTGPEFTAWGFLTSLALIFNVPMLYRRTGLKGILSKTGHVFLWLGVALILATVFNLGLENPARSIHVATAILFAVCELVAIFIPLILVVLKRNKAYMIASAIFTVLLLTDLVLLFIFVHDGFEVPAFFEMMPLIVALAFLFFTNFTKPLEIVKKQDR
jgi:hypothetical protein